MIKNRMCVLPLGFLCAWGAIQNQVVLFCVEWLCMNVRGNKGPLRPLRVSECCLEFVRKRAGRDQHRPDCMHNSLRGGRGKIGELK